MEDLHFLVEHLCHNKDPVNTPIATVFDKGRSHIIHGKNITAELCAVIRAAGPGLGLSKMDVSVRSLHNRGEIFLLLASVNTNTFHLMGRWRSNKIIRYLHTTTNYLAQELAARMMQLGAYVLITLNHCDL